MTSQCYLRVKCIGAAKIVVVLLLATLLFPFISTQAEQIAADYTFERPNVSQVTIGAQIYHRITMDNTPNSSSIGQPSLPARGAQILLPYGTGVADIQVETGERVLVGRYFLIEPAVKPALLSAGPGTITEPTPDPAIYGSSLPFPAARYEKVGIQTFRGYAFVVLKLCPVEYVPSSGELYYYPHMRIVINTEAAERSVSLYRGMAVDESEILTRVDNPDLMSTYPAITTARSNFDLLIITTPELAVFFQRLKNHHDTTGIPTEIRTTADIGSNDPTAVRDYIRSVYETDGIQYVLIGGDDDVIPAIDLYVKSWEESEYPEDPYIEYDLPGDIYFACLDDTYNYDGDGYWAEPTDGYNGSDVDLVAEVYVGRAPVGTTAEADRFARKTISYLNSDDPYLKKALWLGEYIGFGGTGDYGCYAKEEIIDINSTWGYTTAGLPTDIYDFFKLYDMVSEWTDTALVERINEGAHIINHCGHGYISWSLKMNSLTTLTLLENHKLFFLYSQCCSAGHFDNSDCWAEYVIVKNVHGAFAVIMNARGGWGTDDTDGPSQRFDREFFDAIFGEGKVQLARANQDSKEDNLYRINEPGMRWCTYQLTLFGDPTVALKGSQSCAQSGLPDGDGDGACDAFDNCPVDSNADQSDSDGDGVGDPCDTCPGYDDLADTDNDGIANGCDINCGDINGDLVCPDITDVVYLVAFFFDGGPPPPERPMADIDGSPGITISDLTYLADYMFDGGPAPTCPF